MFKRPNAILSQTYGVPIKLLLLGFTLLVSSWNTEVLAQISLSFDITHPSCAGLNVGSKIVCTPSGGTAPYTFVWSTGATTGEVSSLAAGTYTVSVTDAASRTATGSATLADPPRINVAFESQSCTSPATIKATGSGGFPPYTYTWDGMVPGQIYTATQPGKYCVTVTDSKLCGKIACFTVSINPMILDIKSTAINCPGVNNGSANVTVSGGTAPYEYKWSNGATTSAINNLQPGAYSVTVIDAGGCSGTATTTLANKAPIQIALDPDNPICTGDLNGAIAATASGGNGGFIYRWSTGATTNTIAGLGEGIYSVTATDVRGCSATAIDTLLPGSNLNAKPIGVPVSCPGNIDGFALVEVTGGTLPYTFNWAVGGSNNTISKLAPGIYRVTVTDGKGCTKIVDVEVKSPPPIEITLTSTNNNTCGVAKGTAKVKATGGVGPFTYLWNNGATTDSISNLASGTYRVTVTDAKGCQKFGATTVTEPPSMELTLDIKQIDCTGQSNGRITALVSGGTAPFVYVWSNKKSTQTIDTLAPGTYGVIVRDAKACVVQGSATLLDPPALIVNLKVTDFLCGNSNAGTGQITVSGGTAPYKYLWSNGATTSSVQNIPSGIYSITVTDARNCIETAIDTILISSGPKITAIKSDVNCFGENNGRIAVNASGGNGTLTYNWSNGRSTSTISNLSPGIYRVTVTDQSLCSKDTSFVITQPNTLSLTMSGNALLCGAPQSGSARATVSGGTTPYSYQWSNGATTSSINQLNGGPYKVTVTDARECQVIDSFRVQDPGILLCQITVTKAVSAPGVSDGEAEVKVSNGTAPYKYLWSNGATTSAVKNLNGGTYSVTTTDVLGCSTSCTISLIPNKAVIGDMVWFDKDEDGIMDAGEPGVPGIKVILNRLDAGNTSMQMTTTGANGKYLFTVDPGCYKVTFALPDTLRPTQANQGANDALDSDADPMTYMTTNFCVEAGTTNLDWDAGVTLSPKGNTLGSCVCLNNATDANTGHFRETITIDALPGETWRIASASGVYRDDSPNPPAAPLPIAAGSTLPSTSPGIFSLTFRHIDAKGYTMRITNGIDTMIFRNTCAYPTISINNFKDTLCVNAAPVVLQASSSVPGEISFTLNGQPINRIDPSTLAPGTYVLLARLSPSSVNECEAVLRRLVVITRQNCPASLGDYVWHDLDRDGIQEPGEPGVPGITVKLLNPAGTVLATDVTDANGLYGFNNLVAGNYVVMVNVPAECQITTSNAGSDDSKDSDINGNGMTGVITLASGENNPTIDAGIFKFAALGDYVWYDLNQNGIQDQRIDANNGNPIVLGPELPVAGARIELYKVDGTPTGTPNENGTLIGVQTTDANGKYLFTQLVPGNYYIKFDNTSYPDTDYVVTAVRVGTNINVDSDINRGTYRSETTFLESGEIDLSFDMGIFRSPRPDISDPCGCDERIIYIPKDPNNTNYIYTEVVQIKATPGGVWRVINKSGSSNATTFGLLRDGPSVDYYPEPYNAIGTPFTEVSPGVYEYKFFHQEPRGYGLIATDGTSDLNSGRLVDLGISAACTNEVELYDSRLDNVCAYSEPIDLKKLFPGFGATQYFFLQNKPFVLAPNVDESVFIEAAKRNPITILNPTDYPPGSTVALYIRWVPEGYDTIKGACPKTVVLNVFLNNTDSTCVAGLGDYVWADFDNDGIQESGEPGIGGVTVKLLDANGKTVATDTTDSKGLYGFGGLKPGTYSVMVNVPAGYTISPANQGGDDAKDSDINANGMTQQVVLKSGDYNPTLDAGLYKPCINLTDAGVIGYNQRLCAPGADPAKLVNIVSPSGAPGPVEYLWMKSVSSSRFDMAFFEPIPNSDAPEYDPGPLQKTTYFARCVRIKDANCPFIENNVVTIEVGDDVKIDWKSPTGFCVKDKAVLQIETATQNAGVRWDFDSGVSPRVAYGKAATVSFEYAGRFGVTVTVSENNCVGSFSTSLSVSDNPTLCGGGVNSFGLDAVPMNDQTIRLNWAVRNDGYTYTFDVQRSKDAVLFDKIGTVKEPLRIKDGNQEYEYIDYEAKRGINVYRVRMINNVSGNDAFSKLANTKVGVDADELFNVYPNPVTDRLVIQILQQPTSAITLELFNADGRLRTSKKVDAGALLDGLDLDDLPAGFYVLKLNLGELGTEVVKIVKK